MPRWSRFRRLFGPEPKADVDAELSFHVEMRVRELIEQGVPPERARTLALQRFGDYDGSRAACVEISKRRGRRMARTEYLTELRQDAVYALRMLRRAPGFTIVALTTLALGIGANSAIFSVVQGVLLAPLPFRDAERLYRVTTLYPDGSPYSLSAPDFMSVREQTRTFDQVEAFSGGGLHHARRRRAARGSRHERERRPAEPARAAGRCWPGVPARREPTGTRQSRGARPRILAASVRRRSQRARTHLSRSPARRSKSSVSSRRALIFSTMRMSTCRWRTTRHSARRRRRSGEASSSRSLPGRSQESIPRRSPTICSALARSCKRRFAKRTTR